jgi:hypothetical protein
MAIGAATAAGNDGATQTVDARIIDRRMVAPARTPHAAVIGVRNRVSMTMAAWRAADEVTTRGLDNSRDASMHVGSNRVVAIDHHNQE